MPAASTKPSSAAVPANVEAAPSDVTFRTTWLSVSATYTLPFAGSTTRASGLENSAADPVPFMVPGVPEDPANVVTTPASVTRRTL